MAPITKPGAVESSKDLVSKDRIVKALGLFPANPSPSLQPKTPINKNTAVIPTSAQPNNAPHSISKPMLSEKDQKRVSVTAPTQNKTPANLGSKSVKLKEKIHSQSKPADSSASKSVDVPKVNTLTYSVERCRNPEASVPSTNLDSNEAEKEKTSNKTGLSSLKENAKNTEQEKGKGTDSPCPSANPTNPRPGQYFVILIFAFSFELSTRLIWFEKYNIVMRVKIYAISYTLSNNKSTLNV